MTQIEAGTFPTGKASAKYDTGSLRDRNRGGQADANAARDGERARFGDHWRSILSGGGNLAAGKASVDSARGEAGESVTPPPPTPPGHPSQPSALTSAAAETARTSARSIDASLTGTAIDISDVLAALQEAGSAQDRSESRGDPARTMRSTNADGLNELSQHEEWSALRSADERAVSRADPDTPTAREIVPAALRESFPARTQAPLGASAPQAARGQPLAARAQDGTAPRPDLHLASRAEAGPSVQKATVVHQATHFAPALGTNNLQALSGAIAEMSRELPQGAERALPESASQQPGARPTGPVKTLTIQLTPISLGKVTIEMRMTGGGMRVDIQVADPKALELVRADRDLLASLVRKTGIAPDTITIQTADNTAGSKPGQTGQNLSGHGGANGSASGREASRDGSARNDGTEEDDRSLLHEDRSTDGSRLRDDIYL